MSDLESLWRAVLASPDADTPRLICADAVQESGDEERAELIRVQCEFDPVRYHTTPAAVLRRRKALYERESELLAVHREQWEPVCVTCGGSGRVKYQAAQVLQGGVVIAENAPVSWDCSTCKGTGRQPCRWERGFPVVRIAEMRQAWECFERKEPGKQGWRPTPWLCDLLRTHHVAGVELPGETVISRDTVPPRVWEMIDFSGKQHFAPQLGRAVVLAALEWLDAQGDR